jgi:hypothetical protein
MISTAALLPLLISLVIAGLIFWLVLWFIGWVGVPEPFNKVIKVVFGLAILIYLVNVLLGVSGHPLFR